MRDTSYVRVPALRNLSGVWTRTQADREQRPRPVSASKKSADAFMTPKALTSPQTQASVWTVELRRDHVTWLHFPPSLLRGTCDYMDYQYDLKACILRRTGAGATAVMYLSSFFTQGASTTH